MTAVADRRDASPFAAARSVAPRRRRTMNRPCGWCRRQLEATRSDVRYCTTRCRQAAWRAAVEPAPLLERDATDPALRLAYADPPYPGNAARYYGRHPDFGGEVDHATLLEELARYDGWALSTAARALPAVLALCVAQDLRVRVAVWVRGARPHATAHVLNAWEPVVFVPGRHDRCAGERDVFTATPRRRTTLPTATVGMKPPAFAAWVFRLLGARRGDDLDDLFPGSGLVGRSWELYQGRDPSRGSTFDASCGSATPVVVRARAAAGADASRLAVATGDG